MASQIYQADQRLLADLDEEISALVRRLADLRARRNALVPISRIPNELLSRVFAELFYQDDSEAVLPPSHVCRFWRAVALEARGLWVQPKLDKVALDRMMLERAGSLPLVLTIHDDIFAEDTFALVNAFATEAIPRARELCIESGDGFSQSNVDSLRLWLAPGAPDLVCLDATRAWLYNEDNVAPIFPAVDVLLALKVLRASSWAIGDCRVHRLPNLTTLELDGDGGTPYYPVSHICAMLQEMKALQILILRHVMDTADSWAGAITLPHLRHLGLKSTVARCFQLVKALRYPADTRISVSCSPTIVDLPTTREDAVLFPELVAILRGNWLTSGRTGFHEMCIQEEALLLRLYNSDMRLQPNYDESIPALHIELVLDCSLAGVLLPAIKVLPSLNSQVNKLVLHVDHYTNISCNKPFDDDSMQHFSVLLGNSRCGDSLVVYGCRSRLLCSVLSAHRSSLRDMKGPSHIQLVNPSALKDQDMQGLHEWLERRVAGTGRPLETLELQLSKSTLSTLQKPNSTLVAYWHGLVENVTIGCKGTLSHNTSCGSRLPYTRDERFA